MRGKSQKKKKQKQKQKRKVALQMNTILYESAVVKCNKDYITKLTKSRTIKQNTGYYLTVYKGISKPQI